MTFVFRWRNSFRGFEINYLHQHSAFSLIEFLFVFMLFGIIWEATNISGAILQQKISHKRTLNQLKTELESQIIYANTTGQIITVRPENTRLQIIGNKFISEIKLPEDIAINSEEQQLKFHPRQVCSPSTISTQRAIHSCQLVLSLRCRLRIQC